MICATFFRLLFAFLILCPLTLGQDQRRQTVQQQQLRRMMSAVDVDVPEAGAQTNQPKTYRELKIRWADPTKSEADLRAEAATQIPKVSILEDKKQSGTLPRSRSLELAPTLMFVAGIDASNKLRWWSIMQDPRVVRVETRIGNGELARQDFYAANVTLIVAFPDDPEIATLRFYHPVWNGTDFDLKLLTAVPTR